jgi:hypothetical protein
MRHQSRRYLLAERFGLFQVDSPSRPVPVTSMFGGISPFRQQVLMRWPCLLLPAVALLSGADAPKKPPADGDRIQGVWNLVSSERGGKAEAGGRYQRAQEVADVPLPEGR